MSIFVQNIVTGGSTTIASSGGVVRITGSTADYTVIPQTSTVRLDVVTATPWATVTVEFTGSTTNPTMTAASSNVTIFEYYSTPYWALYCTVDVSYGEPGVHWTLVATRIGTTGSATTITLVNNGLIWYNAFGIETNPGTPTAATKYKIDIYWHG